jgi:D-alanyl-D-alanine dipeptidase
MAEDREPSSDAAQRRSYWTAQLDEADAFMQTVGPYPVLECGGHKPPLDLLCRRLAALVANSPKVGTHLSGSAMDISVLRRDTGEELDRGGFYPEMSERTPMDSPFVSATARANRRATTDLMRRHGFVAYPWEFWHYNAGDAYAEVLNRTGKPARYGPVVADLAGGRVTPVARPDELLNPPTALRGQMERILAATTANR